MMDGEQSSGDQGCPDETEHRAVIGATGGRKLMAGRARQKTQEASRRERAAAMRREQQARERRRRTLMIVAAAASPCWQPAGSPPQ